MRTQGHPVLTRRGVAVGAAAVCLAWVTALAPAAAAAPQGRAAAVAPAAHGRSRISPIARATLFRDLRAAWQITHGDGVTIAFVAPGVDPATPGLAGKVTVGPRFGRGRLGSKLTDSLIAAAVAGQGLSAGNPFGAVGIASDARVLSLRVPCCVPDGAWERNDAQAIRYAVKHHAGVIYVDVLGDGDEPVLDNAVQAALAKGVVVVGSGVRWRGLGRDTLLYPNTLPGVLTDGAVTVPGAPTSCRGRYLPPPRGSFLVVAPANDIVVASASGDLWSLCYSAAADVWLTGAVTLIKAMYPHLPPSLVARAIAMSARDQPRGFSPDIGFGMLNPVGALRAAAKLQHLPISARPGPAVADPAARLAAGPVPGTIRAVRHSPALLASYAAAMAAGAVLLAVAAVVARPRRRQARVRIS